MSIDDIPEAPHRHQPALAPAFVPDCWVPVEPAPSMSRFRVNAAAMIRGCAELSSKNVDVINSGGLSEWLSVTANDPGWLGNDTSGRVARWDLMHDGLIL